MEPETLTVPINERDTVSALLYAAPSKQRSSMTVILGHGAGANQLSPFMRLFANGLAQRGFDTITFNFLYMEQGRRVPDPKERLESCYRAVIQTAQQHTKLKGNRIVIGGKSMGGRIASQVAAAESSLECADLSAHSNAATIGIAAHAARTGHNRIAALVLLGYPLHPPGKPEKMRDQHLKDVRAPMLFIQGSRDAFGTPEELRAVIKNHKLPAKLHIIEGGDHSFKVSKSSSVPQQRIYEDIMDETSRWLLTAT
ncbi:MAG: alpha/beta fold hydrolase [Acidobacteriota bacterium]|nr:alpha/beta fold hydrolase [Acidobacteriota bacterium]